MITRKQKAIIAFIVGFITFTIVYYILSILWGSEKINLGAAVITSIFLAFVIYKQEKWNHFTKRIRGRVVAFFIHKKNK